MGPSCETKPIDEGYRAKRSQSAVACGTNKANSAEAAGWASTWWKKSYGELNMQEPSAKQSQFPPDGHGQRVGGRATGGTCRAKRSQFASARPQEAPPGPVVQTKPIGPRPTGSGAGPGPEMPPPTGQTCETKPIFAPSRRDGSGIRHRTPAAPVGRGKVLRPTGGFHRITPCGEFLKAKKGYTTA